MARASSAGSDATAFHASHLARACTLMRDGCVVSLARPPPACLKSPYSSSICELDSWPLGSVLTLAAASSKVSVRDGVSVAPWGEESGSGWAAAGGGAATGSGVGSASALLPLGAQAHASGWNGAPGSDADGRPSRSHAGLRFRNDVATSSKASCCAASSNWRPASTSAIDGQKIASLPSPGKAAVYLLKAFMVARKRPCARTAAAFFELAPPL